MSSPKSENIFSLSTPIYASHDSFCSKESDSEVYSKNSFHFWSFVLWMVRIFFTCSSLPRCALLAAMLLWTAFFSLVEEFGFCFIYSSWFSYLVILAFAFSIFSSLFSSIFSRRLLHRPVLLGGALGSSKSSCFSVIYTFGVVFILIKFVESIFALRLLVNIPDGDEIIGALSFASAAISS